MAVKSGIPKLSLKPLALGQAAQVPMSVLREKPNRNSFSVVALRMWSYPIILGAFA